MNKKSLIGKSLIVGFSMSIASMYAQNTFPTTGNVGIGTTTPEAKLQVAGGRIFLGSRTTSGEARIHLYNNAASAEWLFGQKSAANSNFNLSKAVLGAETDFFTVDTSGNVGLSNATPTQKLDVNGGVKISTLAGTGTRVVVADTNGLLSTQVLSGGTITAGPWSQNGSYVTLNTTNTNVGIGISNPEEKFQVTGGRIFVGSHTAPAAEARIHLYNNAGGGEWLMGQKSSANSNFIISKSVWGGEADYLSIDLGGKISLSSLAGTGTRMVVADANGALTTQAIPTGGTSATSPWTLSGNNVSLVTIGNNVGIGTTAPEQKFQVTGGRIFVGSHSTSGEARFHLYNNGGTAEWIMGQKSSSQHNFTLSKIYGSTETDYFSLDSNGKIAMSSLAGTGNRMVVADANGILTTQAIPTGGTSATSPWTISGNNISNSNTGTVSIGTVNAPTAIGGVDISKYKLYVKGGILSDEVRVRTGWADYVFDNQYKLKSLDEVEKYITDNKHLPNVPSATEVESKGLNVGDMMKIQQEKIEELTLYIIQLKKEMEGIKSQIKTVTK